MATKTVDLADFSSELSELTKRSLQDQHRAIMKALMKAIPRLVAASPVDTGLYAQSWDMTFDEKQAVIGNYAPHAAVIEYGARPFTPPLEPLLAWAKRVLKDDSQPEEESGGYSQAVYALAMATRAKIQREGFAPQHILENQIPLIIEDIKRELFR